MVEGLVDIEERTRKVEEAVIEFRHIATFVVGEYRVRLNAMDEAVHALKEKDAMHSQMHEETQRSIKYLVGLMALMFSLFLGGLTYTLDSVKAVQELTLYKASVQGGLHGDSK